VPYFDFISSSAWNSREQTHLLDERCIVARHPLAVPGYNVGFRDRADGVTVYINDRTSALNTPELQPIPATTLRDRDREMLYEVTVPRWTTVIVSAIVYPGWHVRVDGRVVHAESFRVRDVPIFPEVALPPGRHRLQYSWSGWPS
jgi:hypothetical protein